jgi:hypothetical protein
MPFDGLREVAGLAKTPPSVRTRMDFEAGLAIAVAATTTCIVIDWPRALAGLAFGAISQYLPYCTFVMPVGSVIIATVGEVLCVSRFHRRLGFANVMCVRQKGLKQPVTMAAMIVTFEHSANA